MTCLIFQQIVAQLNVVDVPWRPRIVGPVNRHIAQLCRHFWRVSQNCKKGILESQFSYSSRSQRTRLVWVHQGLAVKTTQVVNSATNRTQCLSRLVPALVFCWRRSKPEMISGVWPISPWAAVDVWVPDTDWSVLLGTSSDCLLSMAEESLAGRGWVDV